MSQGTPEHPGPFAVAEFNQVVAEQSSKELAPVPTPNEPPRSAGTGGISGVVTDQQGAVITNAEVVAVASGSRKKSTTVTDNIGAFTFRALPVGAYRLEFKARGFQDSVVLSVPVKPAGTTTVDPSLEVGESG